MPEIKRAFFAEYNTGCLYHPNPGCVHMADEEQAQFISSLCERRPDRHAPALDIDFPTTVQALEDGTILVGIIGPRPRRKPRNDLLEQLVACGLMDPVHAKELYLQVRPGEDIEPLPTLRLKVPVKLVPSSSAGHFHLYLEHAMDWELYKNLLLGLRDTGVIGRDFCTMCIRWRVSFLLKPGLAKSSLKAIYAGPESLRGN